MAPSRLKPSPLPRFSERNFSPPLDAGHPERAVELLEEAVLKARQAGLLAQRIKDAEQALQGARAAQQAEAKPT